MLVYKGSREAVELVPDWWSVNSIFWELAFVSCTFSRLITPLCLALVWLLLDYCEHSKMPWFCPCVRLLKGRTSIAQISAYNLSAVINFYLTLKNFLSAIESGDQE